MAESHTPQLDTSTDVPAPPIAAAFLVNFDHRKGYTLTWYKSIEGVQIEGTVEFKSLPSGLHNVEEDLVYFIHKDYAGLSAFLNVPDEHAERKARMLAIGVLVPLEHGRMGRIWRHAETLKSLARSQIQDVADTSQLEHYWDTTRLDSAELISEAPNESTDSFGKIGGYRKSRSMSTATNYLHSAHHLTPHHPASNLLASVQLFGPLVFPLFRAALLRKRILILAEAPVEFSCDLVYNISILSSLSRSLLSLLPDSSIDLTRLRPLFTIGVSDIDLMKAANPNPKDISETQQGWIACTTDDVLSTKPDLYDLLVLMPSTENNYARRKVFPRLIESTPLLTRNFPQFGQKSTQRDFHRYVHLQQGLEQFPSGRASSDGGGESDESSSLDAHSSAYIENKHVVEPPSWSRVAYTSLVWWASAGDRRGGFSEMEEIEMERDLSLLQNDSDEEQIREVALVAYFHRLTNLIFTVLAEAIARADGRNSDIDESEHEESGEDTTVGENSAERTSSLGGDEDDDTQPLLSESGNLQHVEITQDDMTNMGLDSWSASDKIFVENMISLWWGRKADVRAASVECCGLRIL
ncbi:hypothetical protein LTR84_003241 [Exophiala bonariae]|uniref:DUF4484 domain-containing protein n=1 Tax=Exophiala bonariae TaxID=1690606 RepID=A0AAV9NBZ6_9EURO|nr:hypothetical protein LTR84_003241 [Exophiala bonariae]